MALLDIQVTLNTTSGVPENKIVNVWHFDDTGDPTGAGIANALEDFYNDIVGHYPAYITQAGHLFKAYQVSDPEPRAPIWTFPFAFSSVPSGNPLPLEVAAVVSYQAEQVSGIPQARRRGRIYIGPLDVTLIGADGRFTSAAYTTLETAAQTLLTASLASATWKWSTHSRVLGSGDEVMNGWVDNEPDTQRRRGRDATVRVTFE